MAITLKAARINKGLTQEKVAELLHISENTLGKYEKNARVMPTGIFKQLCELYDLNMDDIFLG